MGDAANVMRLAGQGNVIPLYAHQQPKQIVNPGGNGYLPSPDYFETPPTQQWLELPLIFKHVWDAWPDVDSALIELEYGMFRKAAWLCDAMLMDDRLYGCLTTRVNGLLGCDMEFTTPDREDGEDPKGAQAECEAAIKELYPRMIPRSVEQDIERWGLMLNTGLAELVWQRDGGLWVPQMKIWNPQNLFWRPDTRAYNLITQENLIELTPGNGQWAMFTPNRNHYGWMYGMVRPLARLWLQRMYTFRDWARWSEVYGNGIKKAFVPMGADKTDLESFMGGLNNPGAESVVLCPVPKADDRTKGGYDVEMVQVQEGTGWQGFEGEIKQLDTSIAICMLGQNLSTESKPTGLGAGTAKLQSNVRRDFLRADAQNMAEFLRDQVLRWFCYYNWGDEVQAPLPMRQVDPPEDKSAETKSLADLGVAVTAFTAGSLPVDYRALLDKLGVPLLKEGEPLQIRPPDAAQVPYLDDVRDENGVAVGEPHEQMAMLRSRGLRLGPSRAGATYASGLARAAKKEAAKILRRDVSEILTLMDHAAGYDGLRRALVHKYRDMSPRGIAELTESVLLLAQLAGRKAAGEESK